MTGAEILARDRIVRAAIALIRHWQMENEGTLECGPVGWGHKGPWFPLNSEKPAQPLINACVAYKKMRAKR